MPIDFTQIEEQPPYDELDIALEGLAYCPTVFHAANAKWWQDPKTGQRIERNKGELIALMHSELSECLEAERKGKMDDHLPHRRGAEVELADCLIRIFDYAGSFGYDLAGAVREKNAYNAKRADHTHAERLKAEGKKF